VNILPPNPSKVFSAIKLIPSVDFSIFIFSLLSTNMYIACSYTIAETILSSEWLISRLESVLSCNQFLPSSIDYHISFNSASPPFLPPIIYILSLKLNVMWSFLGWKSACLVITPHFIPSIVIHTSLSTFLVCID